MLPNNLSSLASALPVILVIALSVNASLAISSWLVYQVARRAIEKADSHGIPSVILALGSLLGPLRMFMPWNSLTGLPQNMTGDSHRLQSGDNDSMRGASERGSHG